MTPQHTGTVLELRGIGVSFGGLVALQDVSLTAATGTVVGVIGPNGAGKTTLFNVVCGFVEPDAGTVLFEGAPLRPRPHRLASRGIARTLQGVGLFRGLTVLENVMAGATHTARAGLVSALFGPAAQRPRRAPAARRGDDAARAVGRRRPRAAPGRARCRTRSASGSPWPGRWSRRPRLLLLDEPAGGLGGDDVEELAALIVDLPNRSGAAR